MAAHGTCWSWKTNQMATVGVSTVKNDMHTNKEDPTEHGCPTPLQRHWSAVSGWFLLLVYWQFAYQPSAHHHLLYWTVYYTCELAQARNSIIGKAEQQGRGARRAFVFKHKTIVAHVKTPSMKIINFFLKEQHVMSPFPSDLISVICFCQKINWIV